MMVDEPRISNTPFTASSTGTSQTETEDNPDSLLLSERLQLQAVKGSTASQPLLSSQSPAAGHPGSGTQAHRILQQSFARQTSPQQD
jgi:hypothetical protein